MSNDEVTFRGEKAIERALAAGQDPNADLDKKEDSKTRAASAVALRVNGASYSDIAKVLGYASAHRARLAVERSLAAVGDSPEAREQLKVLMDRRLNRLLQSVMPKAVNPKDPQHLAYNARALAIIDRQAKFHGLDAPTQVQISATEEQIAAYVAAVRPLAAAQDAAEEADIIDMGEFGSDEEDI